MGNHSAGKAMGVAANAAMFGRKSIGQKDALRLLDIICEPWRGCDARKEMEVASRSN